MTDLIKQISGDLQKQIEDFQPQVGVSDIGTVLEAGDGIARVQGLANVKAQELVQFANGVMGTAFNLEKDSVGVIIMGEYDEIAQGMTVRGTGRIASVPVGDAMIGRVVNALGEPIDGKGPIATTGFRPIEPGGLRRSSPVDTGLSQPGAQRPRRHARRRDPDHLGGEIRGPEFRERRVRGHGDRDSRAEPRPDLRPVLQHQEPRQGNRAGVERVSGHHQAARGPNRRAERRWQGHRPEP